MTLPLHIDAEEAENSKEHASCAKWRAYEIPLLGLNLIIIVVKQIIAILYDVIASELARRCLLIASDDYLFGASVSENCRSCSFGK